MLLPFAGRRALVAAYWIAPILNRARDSPALVPEAAFFVEGLVQAFGELPERAGSVAKLLVFFLQSMNSFNTRFQVRDWFIVGHDPTLAALSTSSKKDADSY